MEWEEREHHLHKQIGGMALIVSPLLGLLGVAIAPPLRSDAAAWLARVKEASTRAQVSAIFMIASLAVAVYAVLALTHLLREREWPTGQIGGGFALVGIVLTTINTGFAAAVEVIARSSGNAAVGTKVIEDWKTSPVALVALGGSLLFSAGLLILAFGLYRAEAAPAPCAIGIGLFAVGSVVGFATFSSWVAIVSFAVLFVSAAPIGWEILTEGDASWEHTPRFHGFKPIAT